MFYETQDGIMWKINAGQLTSTDKRASQAYNEAHRKSNLPQKPTKEASKKFFWKFLSWFFWNLLDFLLVLICRFGDFSWFGM